MIRRPPRSTLFPYTTLFRSAAEMMAPLGEDGSGGGSILTLTYYGAEKVVPHYNVMGVAKADRKSTRLNSSHANISYAVFCLKKKHISLPDSLLHLLLSSTSM